MDHRTIDAENIAERYVTGRLAPETVADFEEHYLDCPACCTRVEAAERLERGFRRLAEDAAAGAPLVQRARWTPSPRWGLAAAAMLAVALLPGVYGLREVERLRGDLATTHEALERAEAAGAGKVAPERLATLEGELQKTRQELAAEAEKRETLAREVAAGRQPQTHVPVLPLTPVRSGGPDGGPVRTLNLPKEPGWIALWVEPGEDYPAYRATLRTAQGAVVFQASDLAMNDLGALLLTVHSTTLAPGSYRLDLEGLPRTGGPVLVSRFPLRVV
jgi:hypothetical protein